MKWTVLATLTIWAAASSAFAADVLPSASERFAPTDTREVPSFQRHAVPLLRRLGCNGRACHGWFQGQGGLRLSLLGYDFQADHEALVGGDHPRADVKDAPASLILQKPTRTITHKGGKRMDASSWQY